MVVVATTMANELCAKHYKRINIISAIKQILSGK